VSNAGRVRRTQATRRATRSPGYTCAGRSATGSTTCSRARCLRACCVGCTQQRGLPKCSGTHWLRSASARRKNTRPETAPCLMNAATPHTTAGTNGESVFPHTRIAVSEYALSCTGVSVSVPGGTLPVAVSSARCARGEPRRVCTQPQAWRPTRSGRAKRASARRGVRRAPYRVWRER
jgi:hypothetical protein